METYNGWRNRNTWNVALWFGNDEGLYNEMTERGAKLRAKGRKWTAENTRSFCRGVMGNKTPDGDSLFRVGIDGWEEIANSFNEFSE